MLAFGVDAPSLPPAMDPLRSGSYGWRAFLRGSVSAMSRRQCTHNHAAC